MSSVNVIYTPLLTPFFFLIEILTVRVSANTFKSVWAVWLSGDLLYVRRAVWRYFVLFSDVFYVFFAKLLQLFKRMLQTSFAVKL